MALDPTNMPPGSKDRFDPDATLAGAETLGAGLRAAREASGRSLAQLAVLTRVHTRHLLALEEGSTADLPSRVFTLGYVRAYASALGLDEQLAVERYKRETPDPTVPLQPPTGAAFEEVGRSSPRLLVVGVVVVLAVVGWNVFQRISRLQAPHPSDIAQVPDSWARADAGTGGVTEVNLGAPRPAPPDQTVPALYVTPGLEAELTGVDPADPLAMAAAAAVATGPVQAAFNPRGPIYGAAATASQVILQARKAASLVVRMSDGRVLFARQLAGGESWRAPLGVAAVVDVSDPTAFDVYLNGEHGGPLAQAVTPLAQLNARAQALATQTAAVSAARLEAARVASAARAVAVAPTPSPISPRPPA